MCCVFALLRLVVLWQDEGESLQQQHERAKAALEAEASRAWQEVGRLDMESKQTAAKAAQDLETLQHSHTMEQVRSSSESYQSLLALTGPQDCDFK